MRVKEKNMYLYIYDNEIQRSKHQTLLTKIEARLVDLGINGRQEKYGPLKSLQNIIADGIKNGIRNIIIIGGDKLFLQAVPHVVKNQKAVFGFIPTEEGSRIARVLGIPVGEKACDILSARIIKKIDLGKAGNKIFLFSLETDDQNIIIECDKRYTLSVTRGGEKISICNLGNIFSSKRLSMDIMNDPFDGFLEIVIEPTNQNFIFQWLPTGAGMKQNRRQTKICAKKCIVRSAARSSAWKMDGVQIIKTPFEVEAMPSKLSIIVGKDRLLI